MLFLLIEEVIKIRICAKCGKEIPTKIMVGQIPKKITSKRIHCLECVPFASHSGGPPVKTDPSNFKACKNCGKLIPHSNRAFCNNTCKIDYQYKEFLKQWKNNEVSGLRGTTYCNVSGHIRRFLFEKYDSKCARCGWSKVNPFTNTIPLEVVHIDGDIDNNLEENLTLLCPNCHSLKKTYKEPARGKKSKNVKWISCRDIDNVNEKTKTFDIPEF